jgi:hypothetical protein
MPSDKKAPEITDDADGEFHHHHIKQKDVGRSSLAIDDLQDVAIVDARKFSDVSRKFIKARRETPVRLRDTVHMTIQWWHPEKKALRTSEIDLATLNDFVTYTTVSAYRGKQGLEFLNERANFNYPKSVRRAMGHDATEGTLLSSLTQASPVFDPTEAAEAARIATDGKITMKEADVKFCKSASHGSSRRVCYSMCKTCNLYLCNECARAHVHQRSQ